MRHKAFLLGSVSVAAMSSAVAVVHAQDPVPDGYKVSVEGAALFGPNDLAEDKLGSGLPISGGLSSFSSEQNDNTGWRAAVAVQRQLDPLWDLKVALALNHQFETTSSTDFLYENISSSGDGSSVSGLFEQNNQFDYETIDLEAGYTPEVDGPLSLRLFGGVRGLHYKDSYDKLGTVQETEFSGGSATSGGGAFEYAYLQSGEFYGAGPRVGAEASSRFGDSIFGISGSAAAAFILGRAENNMSFSGSSSGSGFSGSPIPNFDTSEGEWGVVTDFEASLGLDVYLTDTTKLTLGARMERISTLSEFSTSSPFTSGSSGADSGNRLNFGPTIKFEGQF